MVSVADSSTRFPLPRNFAPPSGKIHRHAGRSMRTVRSIYDNSCSFTPNSSEFSSENLTESVVDGHLGELAAKFTNASQPVKSASSEEFLYLSRSFSDFSSSCSSDISGELQRLANLPSLESAQDDGDDDADQSAVPLQREHFSTEIFESISPEDLLPTVKICIEGLQSTSVAVKRSAAANLRLLAKNRADNRALIGESGAIPALIPLFRCSDPMTQENAVTALLNLSLHEANRILITKSGAIKSLVSVLKTGTGISKQNAACTLLSLALIEDNKSSIGACGAIPPLVSLLLHGSNIGKKDAIATLYKLCSVTVNKERVVNAGAVRPLVDLVAERGTGMAEKAMVVLSSLSVIKVGMEGIVEEGGIAALVEAIEDISVKGKEFAVMTLLQLCSCSVSNRWLLVKEGGIPPLVALSQTGSIKTKHMAETLLGYLREPRQKENGFPSSSCC